MRGFAFCFLIPRRLHSVESILAAILGQRNSVSVYVFPALLPLLVLVRIDRILLVYPVPTFWARFHNLYPMFLGIPFSLRVPKVKQLFKHGLMVKVDRFAKYFRIVI